MTKHPVKHGFVADNGLDKVSASVEVHECNAQLHRRIIQLEAERLGFRYVPGQRVDGFELDQAMRARDTNPSTATIERRIALKSNMIRAGVLLAN